MPKIVAPKENWLKLGYQLFSNEGIKGIVVENMAKQLKCNKSSFYWHFKSKAAFVDSLIKFWIETETYQIIAAVEKESTPQKKYDRFIAIAFQHDPYLEFIFYLKRYAKTRPSVQAIIDNIDQQRLAYTASIYEALGYPKKGAKRMASIFYKYLIGYHEMYRYKAPNKNYKKEVKEELAYLLKK